MEIGDWRIDRLEDCNLKLGIWDWVDIDFHNQ